MPALSFLFWALANGALVSTPVAVLYPVAKHRERDAWRWTTVAFCSFLLFSIVLRLPHVGWFRRLDWNWQGLALEAASSVLLMAVARREIDPAIRLRMAPRSALPILGIAALALVFPILGSYGGWRMPYDSETMWFEATLPGIAEELGFRGLIQGLFNRAFGREWSLGSARLGWGWVFTALLFGIAHGIALSRDFHLTFSLVAILPAIFEGLLLGWLRERTGSLWPGVVIHNAVDSVYVIAGLFAG